jgi:hypothetical protein
MDHILVNAPLTSDAKPRRRRRSSEERKAELQGRRKQLELRKRQVEARIAALDPRDQIAARKRETRANIVLGAILRSHASLNPSFNLELAHILHTNVRRPADRTLLADVLGMSHLVPSPTAQGLAASASMRGQKLGQLAPDITARKPSAWSQP